MIGIIDSIKNHFCTYLLERYLGKFFRKLGLDQLTIDLRNGTARLTNINLNVQALNEIGKEQQLPFEFVDGFIEDLSVHIPWSALLSESSNIEITGLKLTVRQRNIEDYDVSMNEFMSYSVQLAQEYLQQDNNSSDNNSQAPDGLQKLANVIESILCKIKIKLNGTVIRIEHTPVGSSVGVAVEVRIENLEYLDEAGSNPSNVSSDPNQETEENVTPAFSNKRFYLEGVSFYIDEFTLKTKSMILNSSVSTSDSLKVLQNSDDELSSTQDMSMSLEKDTARNNSNEYNNPIIFAKLSGRQEVRLKLKENEDVPGPEVEMMVNLGSLTLFLSPRQVHALMELMEGFTSLNENDYARFQHTFASEQMDSPQSTLNSMSMGDTHGNMYNSVNEEKFYAVPSVSSISNSINSNSNTYMGSKISSKRSISSSVANQQSNESSQFHLQISSVAMVLLHENILKSNVEGYGVTRNSVTTMKKTAEEFFEKLEIDYNNQNFESASKMLTESCKLSHLRLLAAPLTIESSENTTSQPLSLSGSLTLTSLEIVECLFEQPSDQDLVTSHVTVIQLLNFARDNSTPDAEFSNSTDFQMKFSHINNCHPHTEFDITLGPCQGELDISIIDRISSLLNRQPICVPNSDDSELFQAAVQSPSVSESCTQVQVSISKCLINLRFPIPNFRPADEVNHKAWCKRTLRDDYASLELLNAKLRIQLDSQAEFLSRHELQYRQMLLTFTEAGSDVPVKIGKVNAEEGCDLPRIVLTLYPEQLAHSFDKDDMEISNKEHSFEQLPRKQPLPFSSKRIIHESDTPHPKCPGDTETREGEELIIPGNRKEMTEFIEEAKKSARIQLEFGLTCVSLQFPSKHLYELIYNRFNTDLMLWQSLAPMPKYSAKTVKADTNALHQNDLLLSSIYEKFISCKSDIRTLDLDPEDDDDDDDDKNTGDSKVQNLQHGQSKVAVSLNIGKGLLTMYSPVKNSVCEMVPGQQGEIVMCVNDILVFNVSEYKSDENLGYVCIMAKELALYHSSSMTADSGLIPSLRSVNSSIPKHCVQTIYRTEPSAQISGDPEKDMLSVAMSISTGHEIRRMKTVKLAASLSHATLNHRVTSNSQTSWFSQLSDFFNVTDQPIEGYSPPGVLTELHLHLWNCAIDYRPLYLPLRSFVSLGNMSVSSSVAAQSSSSTLRFIAEDLALFISNKTQPKLVDLRQNYVSVMQLGLFELSLQLNNNEKYNEAPKVDLRASNDVLHIRTCSDSGRALMQLLTYFASYGDLDHGDCERFLSPENDNQQQQSDETLINDESIDTLSKSQAELVNFLMEEAMEEDDSESQKKNSQESNHQLQEQTEVLFFFEESDDNGNPTRENEVLQQRHVQEPLEVSALTFNNENDDFCVLEEKETKDNVETVLDNGVPKIRHHGTVKVVENHFSIPLGKVDLLKPPKNFPNPVLRYRLREATLVWHIYGGEDFGKRQPQRPTAKARQVVHFENTHKKRQIATYKTLPAPSAKYDKRTSTSWQELGGPGRRRDVLMELQLYKVRFLHEVYPEHTREASWQGLQISELEVRDRLTSSQINKFLHQYTSEAHPRQSNSNMFHVKAMHVRPDSQLPSIQECRLKINLLPLRLNIDQDSLLFLVDFFSELMTQQPISVSSDARQQQQQTNSVALGQMKSTCSKQGTPIHQLPVMSVDYEANWTNNDHDHHLVTRLEDELKIKESTANAKIMQEIQDNNGHPIYFRSVIFESDVLIRLDYQGKRVDLKHGPMAGLLMGLAQLNCSELKLKRLVNRQGLLGFDKLVLFLINEWIQDIKNHQLPGLLGGVGPMYSFVQLFQGVRDLFWLPIEQYQKDGRVVRGLKRGANSFSTSTAIATLELSSRLLNAVQSTAETAYDILSPGPSVRTLAAKDRTCREKYYRQPIDIREGIANAYDLVKEGLGETATRLVKVASQEHEQKGVSGAVGGVLRQIPPTVVKPIILATEATTNVLGGLRSQLMPDARREAAQKWRTDFDVIP